MAFNTNNPEIAPFYVGQEIIAIEDHSQGIFKRGDEFTVQSILKCSNNWSITVGISATARGFAPRCMVCGLIDDNWHFLAKRFVPKYKLGEFVSMKEVMEKQLELTGAN